MSVVLVDTNVFSYVLNGHTTGALYEKHLKGNQQVLCFAVVAELLQGTRLLKWGPAKIARLEQSIRTLTVIPYDLGVCRAWADLSDLRNPDGSARTMFGNDRWIAACAIHHNIPLVSHNRKHFNEIPKLQLISEAP